jgi:hypothetical protein
VLFICSSFIFSVRSFVCFFVQSVFRLVVDFRSMFWLCLTFIFRYDWCCTDDCTCSSENRFARVPGLLLELTNHLLQPYYLEMCVWGTLCGRGTHRR